MVLATPI